MLVRSCARALQGGERWLSLGQEQGQGYALDKRVLVAPWGWRMKSWQDSLAGRALTVWLGSEGGCCFGLSASTILGYSVVSTVSNKDMDVAAGSLWSCRPQASLGKG